MRDNQPVTQREYAFPVGETLVSTTDLDSRIAYVNRAFREVSGFEEDELIGQYHNMIRHPDMPAEAFRDMWDTLRSGLTWRAPVKNRRKDGDHYWVMANVTPLYRGGQMTGYLSVRTEATRGEIDAAAALYRRMNEEAARGRPITRLHRGEVTRHPGWARWRERRSTAAALCLVYPVVTVAGTLLLVRTPVADTIGTPGIVLGLAVLIAWQALQLRRRMVRPIERITQLASHLAGGDLDVRIGGGDRRGDSPLFRAVEQLVVNLRGLVGDVRQVAGEVSQGSSTIARSMNDISDRSTSQAASLQQTSTAMSQMTTTIAENAGGAQQVGRLAREVEDAAAASEAAMTRVVGTMNEIHQASRRIEAILEVLNSLSFQTNILALNASVEAARAGEQGRGFAVVASEVRSLANQSEESTQQIRDLVTASSLAVTGGMDDVGTAHERVAQLKSSIHEVSLAINQISDASTQQAAGVREINGAVTDLDAANQKASERVDASLERTQLLEQESRRLLRAVDLFSR